MSTVVNASSNERFTAADQRRRNRTQTLLAAAAEVEGGERRDLLGQVVELNLGVADALARRYRDRGIAADDLRQVAYLALVKAAHGFDVARADVDFLTYAVPTIRGDLRKHFRDHGWMVRPPRRLQELQTALAKVSEDLTRTLHRAPRAADLAARLGVAESEVREAMAVQGCFNPCSLDHLQQHAFGSLGEAEGAEDPGHLAVEAHAVVAPLLAGLSPRDRQMVVRRFFDDWTQREIGEELGISQMQVSRHLTRILVTLRRQAGGQDPFATAA
ncbi:MAG: sigma-70 region 4 domain protein [Marmoricola sp.]|nr:sigma-70 region 4 domain protein [Marmoricola sp.]